MSHDAGGTHCLILRRMSHAASPDPEMSHTHLACTCGGIGVMMSHAAAPDESHTPGVHVRRHRCDDESCCPP